MLSKLKLTNLRRRSRQSLNIAPEIPLAQSVACASESHREGSDSLATGVTITPNGSSPSIISASTTWNDSARASISSQQFVPPVPPKPNLEEPPGEDIGSPVLRRQSTYINPHIPMTQPFQPISPNAPRIISISDGSWAFASILLVFGQCGSPDRPQDGSIVVHHHHGSFPPTSWPVSDGFFRALVYLEPGPNKLQFEYTSGRETLQSISHITIHMMPLAAPPLHLVILLGSDSPATFDSPPDKIKTQGNGLDTAIKKFRMAAYLWQAYTAEEMARNKFGRRTFRFEETWAAESISHRDRMSRMVPKVHVLRSERTVAEIRDLDIAQQNSKGKRTGELWNVAYKTVEKHFSPKSVYERKHVAVLILDSKWDPASQVITGHAALGGGSGFIQMGIFGSHSLHSWPKFIEDVVPSLTDCTRTDTRIIANDAGQSGSYWEACCIGIGAFLHEVGHAFGCPHQPSGIMVRDYVRFNRSFVTRESYSTRTKSPGLRLCLPKDECHWHRLDILRFRFHPCFKSTSDPPSLFEGDNPQVYGIGVGAVVVSSTGVAWIEIYVNDILQNYYEVFPKVERNLIVTVSDILSKIPPTEKSRKVKLSIFTIGHGKLDIDDFLETAQSFIKLRGGERAFQSMKLGLGGGSPSEAILPIGTNRVLNGIRVYSGSALNGIEFIFDDSSSSIFGNRGGSCSEYLLDTRKGESLLGFSVRSGFWVDGCDILTTLGRRSPFFGNYNGGSPYTMIPPRGYRIAGVSGTVGQWVDSFAIIYK
ncbi:hypothetical protein TWF225_011795 [Orbilia oligospora]|nr:hypothetical protein TWF225_011795 [Orbilia oligospora]KAF3236012.1 hypothetical protein TWF128_001691 [Orbilia oligospora]KAF3236014.1 hypothetical protein TWF128_001691 [Orbilia oligospora]KAF3236121.1 hypothetical protein TWF217_002798 [Orbilia oligospora]